MYESFYQFREKPFALSPDPQFLFLSNQHRMALTQLEYCLLNDAPFCLISGEIGSGKTTLIRHLLRRVNRDVNVGLISNTRRDFGALMHWVCLAFGIDYEGKDDVGLYKAFEDFLIAEYATGHKVVLIVDEAQNLGRHKLEELRLLSNINADKHLLLQIILVGQPELRDEIRNPRLVQLAQRISIDYHIGPLNEVETRNYVLHRLRVAGGRLALFTPQALRVVYQCSRGVPRLINRICDAALVYGFAEQQSRIGADLVREVVHDSNGTGVMATPKPRTVVSVADPENRRPGREAVT